MSYSNEDFKFKRTRGGYILTEFVGYTNSPVMNIPAIHKKRPVVAIGEGVFAHAFTLQEVNVPEGVRRIDDWAFHSISSLRSVSLPASLEKIGREAFSFCSELREVEFTSYPSLEEGVFDKDHKLPAEIVLTGPVCSRDITRPLNKNMLRYEFRFADYVWKGGRGLDVTPWFIRRRDVFALAVENDCFRELDAELLNELIECCAKKKTVEQTAYLLELKKRKFGFEGGSGLEL